MAATIHIHHHHFLLLLSQSPKRILTSHRKWKAESTWALQGAQPIPKAVHRSGCHDKHNCPRPLTPQTGMLPLDQCDLQTQMDVNNLPKIVTQQHGGWESNSQPSSCQVTPLPLDYWATREWICMIV